MPESITSIDGATLIRLTEASLKWLRTNHQAINALNVFPIPDGDTGTNMLLTMQSAYDEIDATNAPRVDKVTQDVAQGALMGARGNSGVILSQIFRGVSHSLEGCETFGVAELATALEEATHTAYRGVVKPVEGTILTVIKDAAAAANGDLAELEDLTEFLEGVVSTCEESVANTPELLPVLKQAGVVDSGGYGLQIIFDGMLRFLRGEPLDVALQTEIKTLDLETVGELLDEMIEPGQDWEVVVDFRPYKELDLQSFYSQLEKIGTSIQVGEGTDLLRVHIHLPLEKRYEPIEYAETLGIVVNVHMENLLDQLQQTQVVLSPPKPEIEPGQILSVVMSPAPGFDRIFHRPGVAIVSGGQTMNPSTQDILAAFEDIPTERVIILPNNKDIQLAAEQAADISIKEVRVLPTQTVPQGIAAQLGFNPDGDLESVLESMHRRIAEVETGEVTTATRNVTLGGVEVQEGKIIGLHNGELVFSGESPQICVLRILHAMGVANFELVTLYYGDFILEEDAAATATAISEEFENLEVEIYFGGQKHYHYIFSAE